jgi:Ca2+-binding RTX toxin-like protein
VSGADVVNDNFVDAGSGADVVPITSMAGEEFGNTINEVEAGDGDEVTVSGTSAWLGAGSENTVSGGAGNDRLKAMADGTYGVNTLHGGAGADTIVASGNVSNETSAVITNTAWAGAGTM